MPKEQSSYVFVKHFLENGDVQQNFYVNTSPQNGIAEIKNRNLLEVARALLFTNKVLKYLWGGVGFIKLLHQMKPSKKSLHSPYVFILSTLRGFVTCIIYIVFFKKITI
jgi:hypothetical protein